MNTVENRIRDLARRHGLHVEKRVTTGNHKNHYATFELFQPRTAEAEATVAAFNELRAMYPHFRPTIEYVNVEGHKELGRPFIEIQSVWCELPNWKDSGEGPFDTRSAAEEFRHAEVGALHSRTCYDPKKGAFIVEVAEEEKE